MNAGMMMLESSHNGATTWAIVGTCMLYQMLYQHNIGYAALWE